MKKIVLIVVSFVLCVSFVSFLKAQTPAEKMVTQKKAGSSVLQVKDVKVALADAQAGLDEAIKKIESVLVDAEARMEEAEQSEGRDKFRAY